MRTRGLIVIVLLLAAPLLAGCGGKSSANRSVIEAKFQRVNTALASYEGLNSQFNEAHFEQATRDYIGLVRKYADTLGSAEARRRLSLLQHELDGYCLPCEALLADEAKKY